MKWGKEDFCDQIAIAQLVFRMFPKKIAVLWLEISIDECRIWPLQEKSDEKV